MNMTYLTRSRPTLPPTLLQTLAVAAALGLGALATGCGSSGGSGASAASEAPPAVVPVPVASRPAFDLTKDVHPFDPALVKQWPGLPNVGTSCYVNAGIKLLAAMPDLDPLLAIAPGDAATTARVRTSLRRIINFIRSGGVLVGAPERDAEGLLRAVFEAFQAHPDLRSSVENLRGGGGFATMVVNRALRVLGAGNRYTLRIEVKTTPVQPLALPRYGTDHSNVLMVSSDPDDGAFDPARVHSTADFIRLAFTEACTFPSGRPDYLHNRVQTFPTQVPDNLVLEFNHHAGPTRALPFSEQVAVATYEVDPAHGTELRQGDVPMRALAATVFRTGHFWAVIRGADGWYKQDDATPSTPVPLTDLDEQANSQGGLTRHLEQVLYQRGQP